MCCNYNIGIIKLEYIPVQCSIRRQEYIRDLFHVSSTKCITVFLIYNNKQYDAALGLGLG